MKRMTSDGFMSTGSAGRIKSLAQRDIVDGKMARPIKPMPVKPIKPVGPVRGGGATPMPMPMKPMPTMPVRIKPTKRTYNARIAE